jgi:hypothetical protein
MISGMSRGPARRSTGPGSSARSTFIGIRITRYLRHRAEASSRASAAVARCVPDGTHYARRDLLAVPARSAAPVYHFRLYIRPTTRLSAAPEVRGDALIRPIVMPARRCWRCLSFRFVKPARARSAVPPGAPILPCRKRPRVLPEIKRPIAPTPLGRSCRVFANQLSPFRVRQRLTFRASQKIILPINDMPQLLSYGVRSPPRAAVCKCGSEHFQPRDPTE